MQNSLFYTKCNNLPFKCRYFGHIKYFSSFTVKKGPSLYFLHPKCWEFQKSDLLPALTKAAVWRNGLENRRGSERPASPSVPLNRTRHPLDSTYLLSQEFSGKCDFPSCLSMNKSSVSIESDFIILVQVLFIQN